MKVWFLKIKEDSCMPEHVKHYQSATDWLQMMCRLLSAVLIGANYNIYTLEVGASMMNIAQALADAKRGIVLKIPHTG